MSELERAIIPLIRIPDIVVNDIKKKLPDKTPELLVGVVQYQGSNEKPLIEINRVEYRKKTSGKYILPMDNLVSNEVLILFSLVKEPEKIEFYQEELNNIYTNIIEMTYKKEPNQFYKMLCISWVQDDKMFFHFYYPFRVIKISHKALNSSIIHPCVTVPLYGVSTTDDFCSYPQLYSAILPYQDNEYVDIIASIGRTKTELYAQLTPDFKMYFASLNSSGKSVIGSFGRIHGQREEALSINNQLQKNFENINILREEVKMIKESIPQLVSKELSNAVNDIVHAFRNKIYEREDLIKNVCDEHVDTDYVNATDKPKQKMQFIKRGSIKPKIDKQVTLNDNTKEARTIISPPPIAQRKQLTKAFSPSIHGSQLDSIDDSDVDSAEIPRSKKEVVEKPFEGEPITKTTYSSISELTSEISMNKNNIARNRSSEGSDSNSSQRNSSRYPNELAHYSRRMFESEQGVQTRKTPLIAKMPEYESDNITTKSSSRRVIEDGSYRSSRANERHQRRDTHMNKQAYDSDTRDKNFESKIDVPVVNTYKGFDKGLNFESISINSDSSSRRSIGRRGTNSRSTRFDSAVKESIQHSKTSSRHSSDPSLTGEEPTVDTQALFDILGIPN